MRSTLVQTVFKYLHSTGFGTDTSNMIQPIHMEGVYRPKGLCEGQSPDALGENPAE